MREVRWRSFSRADYDALAEKAAALLAGLRDGEVQEVAYREEECPACGRRGLRSFYRDHVGERRTVGMSSVWCTHCHRYASATTVTMAAAGFDVDRVPEGVVRGLGGLELPEYLDALDRLWDEGVLPQRIRRR
ncbi:hypothetical protein MF672_014170 [Actinomadura sp. ATCC 31491]|uniref:Transposase n=1 Tax=Actinomadura luzonensis TaxID=2805427 RepID=A0ABT0FRH1_9ACTN|nr:hypothetical protein [Actinomadura luzonensis]MCK2214922.1 hypothetical protein [Actinomadura luzonensis]